mmetsp:Transcript_48013/g.75862  ORF Transcript_48013/g.75862 Transcript_48013/m.75862 type:complete len:144 (-) Transcript_48013:190-621(-)
MRFCCNLCTVSNRSQGLAPRTQGVDGETATKLNARICGGATSLKNVASLMEPSLNTKSKLFSNGKLQVFTYIMDGVVAPNFDYYNWNSIQTQMPTRKESSNQGNKVMTNQTKSETGSQLGVPYLVANWLLHSSSEADSLTISR